jgi:hypothetical protein
LPQSATRTAERVLSCAEPGVDENHRVRRTHEEAVVGDVSRPPTGWGKSRKFVRFEIVEERFGA